VDAVYESTIEVLWAFYQNREDGTPETVAMALGRDADSPMFLSDVRKLEDVGALELVDMPGFRSLGSPEAYKVTLDGEQLLRKWGYPVGQ
jgi:hypothetical protein